MNGSMRAIEEAAERLASAHRPVALTGAGISVESGIPDFRSPGGLWSVFDPMEYATLSCFLKHPGKAWRLYRALARTLEGKEPNPAHVALARLERAGRLRGVVTQNIDGLHQAAGSHHVLEIHGDGRDLQCLGCGRVVPFEADQIRDGPIPLCSVCALPLKPNVVLFEEAVRHLVEIEGLLETCDVLLVVGTSAEVAPASFLPEEVVSRGGAILEFNVEPTRLSRRLGEGGVRIVGRAGVTLPEVASRTLGDVTEAQL